MIKLEIIYDVTRENLLDKILLLAKEKEYSLSS